MTTFIMNLLGGCLFARLSDASNFIIAYARR